MTNFDRSVITREIDARIKSHNEQGGGGLDPHEF